ncbi:hypothetical protein D9M68_973140 [compost metagenome]
MSSNGRLSMRRPFSRISPEATRPGGSSRPMMEAPVSDLPAPDSPTTPRISPGAMSKEMSSSARKVPLRWGNSTTRFLTCNRLIVVHRSLGLSASRSQSPSRFTESAISTSIAPGKMVIHHSPENR